MTTPYAGYNQNLAYTAAKDRMITAGGMARTGLAPTDGVIMSGAGTTHFDTTWSGLTGTTSPGTAMVAGYRVVLPAAAQVVHVIGGASARRDLVILRVYDTEVGDATSQVKVEIVQGTSLTDPTVPARSIVLYGVDVASGASVVTNVVDRRVWAAGVGGVRQVNKIADIAATDIAQGTSAYDLTTKRTWRRDGSAFTSVAADAPLSYTPSYTGDGGNPTASTLTGRYTTENGVCTVWIYINTANNGGGKGVLRVGLPLGVKAGVQLSFIPARLIMPNWGNFIGYMEIAPGASNGPLMFPRSDTSTIMDWWRSCDNNGTAGTGVPVINGGFSVGLNTTLMVYGSYLI